jgi:hypothetical protein
LRAEVELSVESLELRVEGKALNPSLSTPHPFVTAENAKSTKGNIVSGKQ